MEHLVVHPTEFTRKKLDDDVELFELKQRRDFKQEDDTTGTVFHSIMTYLMEDKVHLIITLWHTGMKDRLVSESYRISKGDFVNFCKRVIEFYEEDGQCY